MDSHMGKVYLWYKLYVYGIMVLLGLMLYGIINGHIYVYIYIYGIMVKWYNGISMNYSIMGNDMA